MKIERVPAPTPDVLQVRISGEVSDPTITIGETQPLISHLGPDCFIHKVMLDLGQTTFIDTGGIAWLVGCHKEFERWGGKFVLHSVPPAVAQVFELLKLRTLLRFADNEGQAVQMLESGG